MTGLVSFPKVGKLSIGYRAGYRLASCIGGRTHFGGGFADKERVLCRSRRVNRQSRAERGNWLQVVLCSD